MFIHLKKDLDVELVDWVGEKPYLVSESEQNEITDYGIPKEIQECLAAVRTDLDSFSDIEACSLMTSGYRMTEHEFQKTIEGFPMPEGEPPKWQFLAIEDAMHGNKNEPAYKNLLKHLKAAESLFFKVWMLSPKLNKLKYVGILITILVFIGILLILFNWGDTSIITFRGLGVILLIIIALVIIGKFFVRSLSIRSYLIRFGIGIFAAFIGSIFAKIHLRFFDKWFLEKGKVDNIP